MTLRIHTLRSWIIALVAVSALLGGSSLFAQFQVGVTLDKHIYVSQEPMTCVVTVTNRSGADVVLGGPNGRKWLSFAMTDSKGISMSPLDMSLEDPIVLTAGTSIAKKVVLSETHSVEQPGSYHVTASVYHPASGDYYQSNSARFGVIDIKPYGQPLVFGVPAGFPEAGRVRRYVLMVNRDINDTFLYFRLVDDSTNTKIVTYSLGVVSMVREPQITLDRNNRLNVMFMTNRTTYVYVVVNPDGKLRSVQYVRDSPENRPQLYLTSANEVLLKGGTPFDPVQEQQEQKKAKRRSIGDRPPGL